MLPARFLRFFFFTVVLVIAATALAAPRDKAAQRKIDQAINEDYLATNFDQAESTLLGVIEACEDKCSETLLAKAWMYVGVVRGAGKSDAGGALEAFQTAFGHDPKVKLDDQLTTPELKKLFEKARKSPKKAEAPAPEPEEAAEEEEKPPPKKKKAEPAAQQAPEEKPKKAKKEEAEEPAEETSEVPGGDIPIEEATATEAPKEEAAPKPAEKEEGSCDKDSDCPEGNACHRGTCEERNCSKDSDCGAGSCDEGVCRLRHWVGIHVAQDLSIGGGTACALQGPYTCYEAGSETLYTGYPFEDGVAAPGFAIATTRILLSYDLAVIPNLTIGLRAGYAIGGGPPSVDGTAFIPIHAEARGSYFFGANPLARRGFRPYAYVGGGLAQVDAKSSVVVKECSGLRGGNQAALDACVAGNRQDLTQAEIDGLPEVPIDAYKKLGQGFAVLGGGAQLPLTDSLLLQGNLGFMFMIPTFGFVIEPSLGIALAL